MTGTDDGAAELLDEGVLPGWAFCAGVRREFGVRVQWLGTRPVRLRAWPIGTDWQGWYASGSTAVEAYERLVHVLCGIPAHGSANPRAEGRAIIRRLKNQARLRPEEIC